VLAEDEYDSHPNHRDSFRKDCTLDTKEVLQLTQSFLVLLVTVH
jgi:hypothetical protein